jgi:hypothetical protein
MTEHDTRKKSCPYAPARHLRNADLEVLVPSPMPRGVSFPDFATRRLSVPIVMSAVLFLLAAPAWAQSSRTHPTRSLLPSPSPSPTLTLTFNPQMPSVQDTVPLGTVIATVVSKAIVGFP